MSKEEPRFSVMLTRTEVGSLINALWFHENETNEHIDDGAEDLVERLERRLRQRDTYEAQERRLAADPNPVNPSGI